MRFSLVPFRVTVIVKTARGDRGGPRDAQGCPGERALWEAQGRFLTCNSNSTGLETNAKSKTGSIQCQANGDLPLHGACLRCRYAYSQQPERDMATKMRSQESRLIPSYSSECQSCLKRETVGDAQISVRKGGTPTQPEGRSQARQGDKQTNVDPSNVPTRYH